MILFLLITFVTSPFYSARADEGVVVDNPSTEQSTISVGDQVEVQPSNGDSEVSPADETGQGDEENLDEDANIKPEASDPEEVQKWNDKETKTKLPEISGATGALSYSYPIVVPPGRNGMQPDLALSYNNQNLSTDSIFATGWSVNIPYIQRVNRKGVNKLYAENIFESSMDGELAWVTKDTYGAKDENGQFLKYDFSNNSWVVKDKSGAVYKFGTNISERQDDPTDSAKVYKWMLQEVRDTNNNYIKYQYYKDAGQIYPYKIIYTGNGSTDGIFEIEFLRLTRNDVVRAYYSGFEIKTNYKISAIQTKVNNVMARHYALGYAIGNNGKRQVLSSVTESGSDIGERATAMPPTTIEYKTASDISWSENSSWSLPSDLPMAYSGQASVPVDINADGYLDFIGEISQGEGLYEKHIYLNDGNGGWINDPEGWRVPENFVVVSNNTRGYAVADVNGDTYPDLLSEKYENNELQNYIFINNGDGTWSSNGWSLPNSNWGLIRSPLRGGQVSDINGDGLPDLLYTNSLGNDSYEQFLYLNNGNGSWSTVSGFVLPSSFNLNSSSTRANSLADINADGLEDIMQEIYQGNDIWQTKFLLNRGNGAWVEDPAWVAPANLGLTGNLRGNIIADMNSDGFVDIVYESFDQYTSTYSKHYYVNKGDGSWSEVSNWILPEDLHLLNSINKVQMTSDMNSDGVVDIFSVQFSLEDDTFSRKLYLNNREVFDVIGQINYKEGGHTMVNYQNSPEYKDSAGSMLNPSSAVAFYTVKDITHTDGLGGVPVSTSFAYEGADYYYANQFDRKPSGFNKVITTDAEGNKTLEFYHQGNATEPSNGEYDDQASKIGKVYRVESQDGNGNIFTTSIKKWDKVDLGGGRSFIKSVRTTELTYDGDSDHKDRGAEFTYENTYGNLIQAINYGEVTASPDGSFSDVGSDKLISNASYAINANSYIVGLTSQETVVDQNNSKVSEVKSYYDGQSLGAVTDGNLTKQENWVDGSNYVDVEKTYNTTYGLVVQEKDPRDKTANYVYDSYNLYPATAINPLSQSTSFTYDYSSGAVKQITDQNGRVFQMSYDGFDRIVAEKQPDIDSPSTLVNKTIYTYTDTLGAVKVKETNYLSNTNTVDNYTYLDGLSRPIQTRTEMETGNTFAVEDSVYNSRGLIEKQSIPYESSGSGKTSPTTNSALLVTNSYDAVGRVTAVNNAIGTTASAYDDWKTTVIDPRGKTKDLYSDAYGNLTRVDEHNGNEIYITTYQYSGNNNLVKITDALGNIRNFTYDGLGRRLSAQDLHASGDSTFGTWTYSYDASNNLSSVHNPNNQTVNYTYDDINRVLIEDYTGNVGSEVTYSYDIGTNGIGRLSSVVSPAIYTINNYDPLGNLRQEIKTISGTTFETSYSYDRQGNQVEITNPDDSQVKYTYNTAGQLETVQRKEGADAGFTSVVNNYDYGPHGGIISQTLQNGANTINTYDIAKLYRLSNKTTTITGGSKVQDLSYSYDQNNNVTKIVDASNTNSSKTVDYTYDDLNRLLSAVATNAAIGQSGYTQTFTYNAIGNILTRSDAAGAYFYDGNTGSSYANPHAVTSVGSINYSYDNNGNMLTETGGLSNTWDYNNRLTQSTKGAITSSYEYDQSGQRVKVSNGTTTSFYPNDSYNFDGTTATKQIFANGQLVATVKGTGSAVEVYDVHNDHLAGSSVVTNSSGTKEELMDYYPYGNIRLDEKQGAFEEKRKFIGEEYDAETGLNYLNARYYSSGIGRFVSQDIMHLTMGAGFNATSDPQGLNSYSYGRNNPVVYSDQTGNSAVMALPFLPAVAIPVIAIPYVPAVVLGIGGALTLNIHHGTDDYATLTPQEKASIAPQPYGPAKPEITTVPRKAPTPVKAKITATPVHAPAPVESPYVTIDQMRWYLGAGPFMLNQRTTGDINQELLKGNSTDEYFKKTVEMDYRKKSDQGDGGTADAIRKEFLTKKPTKGRWHAKKGQDLINRYNKTIRDRNTSPADRARATELRNNLKNALNGR